MKKEWQDVVIKKINGAFYVPPNTGKHIHKDRPFHGLVLNGSGCVRDYCFSDGSVIRVKENDLLYLPKDSSYEVKRICEGGCYAINFDAHIVDAPFCVNLQKSDQIKKSFKHACNEWRKQSASRDAFAMSALYEAVGVLLDERERQYFSSDVCQRIQPALDAIDREFSNENLTVERLAFLCGISEVYLRKIFMICFGVSPKEYIIRKRIDYASRLLLSGQFGVSEAALLSGYTEPCHFSREFKKRMGVSPKDYLQK